MFYFIELTRANDEHVVINTLMYRILQGALASNGKIFANNSHFESMLTMQALNNPGFCSLKILQAKPGSKLSWGKKFLKEFTNLLFVIKQAKEDTPDFIYFASVSPLILRAIPYCLTILNLRVNIMIALHGELESLHRHSLQRVEQLLTKSLRSALTKRNENVYYLVFGKHILNRLSDLGFNNKQIITIPHPYIFPRNATGVSKPKLRICHLGVAKLQKRSELFFDFAASEFSDRGRLLTFRFIGPVFPELAPYYNQKVKFFESSNFVSREEFDEQCSASDVACFFQTNENYGLTSSGSLMDAIAHNLIILSFPNDLINILKVSCPEGIFICNSLEEMREVVERLRAYRDEELLNIKQSINALKSMFDLETIKDLFSVELTAIQE